MNVTDQMQQELQGLKERSNLRTLPALIHEGREVIAGGQRMLNLSSNDYLGPVSYTHLTLPTNSLV